MNEKYQRYLALVELLNKPLNLDQLWEECMWSDVNIEDTILTYTQGTRKDCETMTEKVCLKCHRHFKKLDNSIVVNCGGQA